MFVEVQVEVEPGYYKVLSQKDQKKKKKRREDQESNDIVNDYSNDIVIKYSQSIFGGRGGEGGGFSSLFCFCCLFGFCLFVCFCSAYCEITIKAKCYRFMRKTI